MYRKCLTLYITTEVLFTLQSSIGKKMSITVPSYTRRIIFVNTIGILPILLKCNCYGDLYGTIYLKDEFVEFCCCEPVFQDYINRYGLNLTPAPYFGSDLMRITTSYSDLRFLYILRVDRNKEEGEVSENFSGTKVPTLRILATIQVHSFNLTYEELKGQCPETLIREALVKPTSIVQRFRVNYARPSPFCFNCTTFPARFH